MKKYFKLFSDGFAEGSIRAVGFWSVIAFIYFVGGFDFIIDLMPRIKGAICQ